MYKTKCVYSALLVICSIYLASCSGNKSSKILSDTFNTVSYPDTITPPGGFDYHGYLGINGEGGLADYLIHKPHNPNGVIMDFGTDLHVKVSEEYQEQMHKYPSVDVFDKDRANNIALYDMLQTCTENQKDSLEICDCTKLRIK